MNISLRIDEALLARMDRAAKALDRPRTWIAIEAIEQYLAYQEHFARTVEGAIADAESGTGLVQHDEVVESSKARSKGRGK